MWVVSPIIEDQLIYYSCIALGCACVLCVVLLYYCMMLSFIIVADQSLPLAAKSHRSRPHHRHRTSGPLPVDTLHPSIP